MKRISVVGCSGAGKSMVAKRLANALGVRHVELDAIQWGPNWTPTPEATFREQVSRAIADDAWVVDGNYHSKIGTLVWDRADTVIWIDPPRWQVMMQVVDRTLRRLVTRRELWNGNRENGNSLFIWRGDQAVVSYAWSAHPRVRARIEAALVDPQFADLTFHRLRTRRDVDRFLRRIRPIPER